MYTAIIYRSTLNSNIRACFPLKEKAIEFADLAEYVDDAYFGEVLDNDGITVYNAVCRTGMTPINGFNYDYFARHATAGI